MYKKCVFYTIRKLELKIERIEFKLDYSYKKMDTRLSRIDTRLSRKWKIKLKGITIYFSISKKLHENKKNIIMHNNDSIERI